MPGLAVDLIVTDLDGTLSDGVGGTHERTIAALEVLSERGLPVLAATARRPAAALEVMVQHRALLPAVVFDGALGRDFTSGETFHRVFLDSLAAVAVLDACSGFGIEPCLNIDATDVDFLVGSAPSTHPGHLAYNARRTALVDLRTAARTHEVLSLIVCGASREALLPVLDACRPWADGVVTMDRTYGGHSLSIYAKGVSKWAGVESFCRLRGLDSSRVLAVGDGENDVELLTRAAISCVPEDGCDAALAQAMHRIPPARDGGWAQILDVLGL